jgi:PHP family Zn ribbon phosphoesterase
MGKLNVLVEPKEFKDRLKICSNCLHYKPETSVLPARCGECGCVLAIKARFKIFHCPLDPPNW